MKDFKEIDENENFQSYATKDGEHYRETCCDSLRRFKFEILHPKGFCVPDCGVDIDIVARNEYGLEFMIECKGGYGRGKKPGGFRSSDNVRKAIASAYCLSRSETHTGLQYTPLLVMTPYMTKIDSVNWNQLSVVQTIVMIDIVDDRDSTRLKLWQKADYSYLHGHIAQYPSVTWVVQNNPHWAMRGT